MPRIFIPPDGISGGKAELPEAEAKRLMRVLRMRPGDTVTLFDGRNEYQSQIVSLNTKSAILKIIGSEIKATESRLHLILGQGVPKGEKLEWVLQKAVEMGVSSFVPVIMERSVKRPDMADAGKKLARLKKIATEAAQQSGRLKVPEVGRFMDLPAFIEYTQGADLKVILYEGEKTHKLRDLLHGMGSVSSVSLLIGPEGGLKTDEVYEAESAGYVAAGLGPRILRTETAGLAALSIIQYELGDMG